MLTRRVLLAAATAFPLASDAATNPFADLETRTGARIGVAALDIGSGRRLLWRSNERFLMCSTFKFLLVAAVLKRIDADLEDGERIIHYGQTDVLEYAPVTKLHVAEGMSVLSLCDAAIRYSDNTAGNLLLAALGGPSAVTNFARRLGDPITRLDRIEPALNLADGVHDTTTPESMLRHLDQILLGDVLSVNSRKFLTAWLYVDTRGDAMLRAGLPEHWLVGDKTGRSLAGAVNDIAIAIPPYRAPILIAAYTAANTTGDSVLAEIGRLVVARFF